MGWRVGRGLVNAAFPLLIAALLIAAPYFLADYHLSIVRTVLVWFALTVSWHFFSGLTKYVALGSAGFFGLGAYFTAKYLELSYHGLYPVLPIPLIVLLAGLLNFALALAIGFVTLRVRSIYFAILTFGISEMLRNVFQWWEIRVTGTRGTYLPILFDSRTVYYIILASAAAVFILTTLLRRSKFGLALRMIGGSEDTALHVGVNTTLFKVLSFAISAMCIGFVGASFTTRFSYINTDIAFDPLYSFLPAIMTLFGGAWTIYGPITGAVVISLLEEYLRVAYPHYFLAILGSLLMLIVIFMPNGITGLVEGLRARRQGLRGLGRPS